MLNLFRLFTLTLFMTFGTANASETANLKSLIQEYQYQMTVVWDQKDQAFFERASLELTQGLETLKLQGLTQNDLLAEIAGQLNDSGTVNRLELLKSDFLNGHLSQDDLLASALAVVEADQARGASWSGATKTVGITLAVALTLTYIIFTLESV